DRPGGARRGDVRRPGAVREPRLEVAGAAVEDVAPVLRPVREAPVGGAVAERAGERGDGVVGGVVLELGGERAVEAAAAPAPAVQREEPLGLADALAGAVAVGPGGLADQRGQRVPAVEA